MESKVQDMPAGVSKPKPVGFAKNMSPEAQRERAKKGGRNKAAWRMALNKFGYSHIEPHDVLKPYIAMSKDFAHAEMGRLAKNVGGGQCGVGPGGLIMMASIAYVLWMFEMNQYAADMDPAHLARATKLSDTYRLNLQTAQALTAAEARSRELPGHPVVDLVKALSSGGTRAKPGQKLLTMEPQPTPIVDLTAELEDPE